MAPGGGGVCTEKKTKQKQGKKTKSVRDCFKISVVVFYFEGGPVRNKEKCYFCRKKKKSGNGAVSLHRTRFIFTVVLTVVME